MRATVAGHDGTVRSVAVGDRRVLVLAGRAHLYEGHPVATVVHAVRTAVLGGCGVVVLTNAAGSLRPDSHNRRLLRAAAKELPPGV